MTEREITGSFQSHHSRSAPEVDPLLSRVEQRVAGWRVER